MGEAEPTVAWVWCVPLRCVESAERSLFALLDQRETGRAARFATPELRRRFVVSHGVLRLVLSLFTGHHPQAIRILTGERGKPHLADCQPHFSLTHSDDVALIAVTHGGPIGVDVEQVRADIGIDAFARGLLAADDIARIEELPPDARSRAWFQAWTRREAVSKASGEGLREDTAVGHSPFHIRDLEIDETHVGAVAAAPTVARIVYYTLPNVTSALSRFGTA
jgi:4'-phosphopantetheinyl transferase